VKHPYEGLTASLNRLDYEQDVVVVSPKGKLKKISLRDILIDVRPAGPNSLEMILGCEPGKSVRATEVLKQALGMSDEWVKTVVIRKLKETAAIKRLGFKQCINSSS